MLRSSCVAAQLAASQEGLSSMSEGVSDSIQCRWKMQMLIPVFAELFTQELFEGFEFPMVMTVKVVVCGSCCVIW
jgi:hypothetical protein